jgi:hypothetical protein
LFLRRRRRKRRRGRRRGWADNGIACIYMQACVYKCM